MTGVAPLFGALAVGVAGADTIPYVRDILAGTTRPHRGTWFAFAILAIVVTLSQRSDGASWSVLVAAAQAALTAGVFVLSLPVRSHIARRTYNRCAQWARLARTCSGVPFRKLGEAGSVER